MDNNNILYNKHCGEEITTPMVTKRKNTRKKSKKFLMDGTEEDVRSLKVTGTRIKRSRPLR